MNLLISLRSEALKTKRTPSFYLTVVAAVFGPFMSFLDLTFSEGIPDGNGKIIFSKLMIDKFQMTGSVMLPLFIVLISTLLPQIEYKNNAWKQVLASPQAKSNVFLAKFLNIHLLIIAFLITNMLAMFLVAVILHFREPALDVLNQPVNVYDVFMSRANAYVVLLAMSTIQFWLGLRFKNFIVPVAAGISLWIVGTMLVFQFQSSFAIYFPYSFHVYPSISKYQPLVKTARLTSIGYAVALLALGFLHFSKRGNRA